MFRRCPFEPCHVLMPVWHTQSIIWCTRQAIDHVIEHMRPILECVVISLVRDMNDISSLWFSTNFARWAGHEQWTCDTKRHTQNNKWIDDLLWWLAACLMVSTHWHCRRMASGAWCESFVTCVWAFECSPPVLLCVTLDANLSLEPKSAQHSIEVLYHSCCCNGQLINHSSRQLYHFSL